MTTNPYSDDPYSDEVLIARAIENGWSWHEGTIDEWPGSDRHPFTGWKKRTSAKHITPGREYTRWVGVHPNRHPVKYIATIADEPREAFSHEDRCAECGLWVEYGGMVGYEGNVTREFCWTCDHWVRRVVEYTAPDPHHRRAVIDNERGRGVYSIGTAVTPSGSNGFGGSWFTIRFHDGTERRTCDLWAGGEIPERFLDRIPTTAVFVKPNADVPEGGI